MENYVDMKIKGVITGDIVQSSKIEPDKRPLLLDRIQEITRDVSKWGNVKTEIYRGDSFQVVVDNPLVSLQIMILFRAGLLGHSPADEKVKWDARVALGLGIIDFNNRDSVIESDGEAFRNSGREFDKLGKATRLALKTPWDDFNQEFEITTAFVDNVISEWTVTQAQVIYLALLSGYTQKELARELHKTPQAISKLVNGSKLKLLELYLERFRQQLTIKMKL